MLAYLLLTILKHNPLQSKWLRISNGWRGGRETLGVKKKVGFCPLFLLLIRAEELFPAFRAGSADDELAPVSIETKVHDVVGLTKTEQVCTCDGD
ncbi:MAG: hypothetical protein EBT51_10860 [Flavobacteriaceae bacterium]|nr:hypothetical protein [Flavobacteriaceae bacterium]